MALKGIDIFKLSPKTNCKDCGCPTCMAFGMKVAAGALTVDKCPHMSADALAQLSDATAPPMKTITVGAGDAEHKFGGETVLFRHEKTFVSKTLYAVAVCSTCEDAVNDKKLADLVKIDYERIGERMYVEFVCVNHCDSAPADKYIALVKKAAATGRTLILNCKDAAVAKEALEACKDGKPILNGATPENAEAMNALATEYGVALGVSGDGIDSLYDTITKLEGLGNKNLLFNASTKSVKEAFADTVQLRRAAIKGGDRSCGYPSIVNLVPLAKGDHALQTALASLFTMKYGSIVILENMEYSQALPVYGLRQNMFTDPQKPMKVEPGIYPINGADENAVCVTTVDFALTYFVVSGELERSGVPLNLLISDAGGMSVLTAWAAGKLSASTIAKFFEEFDIAGKIKNRTLVIPGKVAVLKGEIEAKLPDWKIVVAPNEAVQLVKFFKDFKG